MKTRSFFFLYALCFTGLVCQGQFRSVAGPGRQWNYYESLFTPHLPVDYMIIYYIDGDTVVNGTTLARMTMIDSDGDHNLAALIEEDTVNGVYTFYRYLTENDTVVLDLSLAVGDTVTYVSCPPAAPARYTLDSTSLYTDLSGEHRNAYHLSVFDALQSMRHSIMWVDGLGTLDGELLGFFNYGGGGVYDPVPFLCRQDRSTGELLCVKDSNQVLYSSSRHSGCKYSVSAGEAPLPELALYPNPAPSGDFYLEMPDRLSGEGEIQLYTAWGQKVWEQKVHPGENRITTGSLPAGVYVLHVKTERETIRKQIVVE